MTSSTPFLRTLRRLSSCLRPHLAGLALAATAMLFVTGIHLARPLILRELIDSALPRHDAGLAVRLGLTFVTLIGAGALALYGRTLLLARIGTSVMARLKGEVFDNLIAREIRLYDRHPPGKLISRVEGDIEQMRGLVSNAAAQLVATTFLAIAITTLIWYQSPDLGRWLAGAVLLGGGVVALYARFIRDLYREVRERDSEQTARLTEFLQGVSLLRFFGREEAAVSRVAAATAARCSVESRAGFYDTVVFYGGINFLAEIGSVAVLIWYGTGEVFAGRMSIGSLVMFLELLRRFFTPLRDLAEVLIQLQSGLAAAGRVFALLEQSGEGTASTASLQCRPTPFRELEFRQVSFAYGEEPVLDRLSFRIRSGQRIGIVGPSGSGKSTCINLLLRFYDPAAGSLLIDGRDLRSIDPGSWRKRVALVQQEIHLFPGTILDNLRGFASDIDERKVIGAARILGAHEFIERLPDGYRTLLAERGANLSLGERQLLCYVRALVRDPELLILDEATSAVDAATEHRLQLAMQRLMSGRTAIIVAHRLKTVIDADRILVLDQGRLAEAGNHADLIGRNGIYRNLATLQGVSAPSSQWEPTPSKRSIRSRSPHPNRRNLPRGRRSRPIRPSRQNAGASSEGVPSW